MSPIKYKITQARVKLGLEKADKLLEEAEASLPYGKALTLEQRLQILETAMQRGTAAGGAMRAAQRTSVIPREKNYDELMAEFDAISDPILRTEFYRENVAAMKRARVRKLYPNAVILERGRRRRQ